MTELLDPGPIFTHAMYRPDELAAEVCALALDLGWMSDDPREVHAHWTLVAAARRGDETWRGDHDVAELLTYAERDAIDYLNDHHTPEGYYVDHDGYAGSFGVWLLDDVRTCDECDRITDAGAYPDWPDGVCDECDPSVIDAPENVDRPTWSDCHRPARWRNPADGTCDHPDHDDHKDDDR